MRLRQAIKNLNNYKAYCALTVFRKSQRVVWRHRHSRQYRRMMLNLWNGYMDASQSIAGDDYR